MIDIEEKEPKVFDQEPKEITIEDAKSYYNAKYLNDRDVYDTDSLATTEAGIVQFVGSLKKLPSQLRMAGGQAMYATGEQMVQNEETREGIRAKLLPQGSMIFNGNLGVKVGEQLKESGKYNIITANRNLETLNREIENEMPNLSEEDRKSWGLMIAQQGLDYGTMLGLSLIHPVLGMGYMGTKIYGQETEEGAEAYKRKFGTIEGFEELSGDELRLNIANTAVQEVIEKAFGAPAQIKSFKAMKDFGKAFFTGFGEEFITENLQNASDAVFDHIGKRLQEDETIWTQITDNFKGTLVAGMFGGTAGTAFAIHNRSQGIQNFEKLLDGSDVAPEDRNALATDLYNAGVNNLQEIITKELELNSQLRAKHGEVYDRIKSQIDKQYRYAGAYEGKTEAEIAQYLEGVAKREADHVLAEAQLRNTLIDNVMNSSDIVFKNGRLYLVNKPKDAKPRQYNPEKMSLLTYLKYKGGLKDVGGDLKAMDAGKQFVGLINNKSGRSLDDAAMDAWESGYFPQFPERPTTNDLLNAISESLNGRKIYRETYRQRVAEKEAKSELAVAEGELDDFLSSFFSQEDIDSMSQDDKQRFYDEIQEQSRATTEDDFIQQEYDNLTEDEQERYSMMRENGATHEEAMDTIQNARGVEGDDIFALYQESMDIAEENARLDEMYPAYEGETITINGQEKTVYNSNGDRIAKSKEALENFYRWFGDSKVVDEQGRPLVVYHGTTKAGFNVFDASKQGSNSGNVDDGFFFGDRQIARTYTTNYAEVREEDTIADEYGEQPEFAGMYNVYLKINEPEIWDFQGASWDGFAYEKYAIYDENEYSWDVGEDGSYLLFDSYQEAEQYLESKGASYRDGDSIEERGRDVEYTIKKNPQLFDSTRELATLAKENGADGLIIQNVNDTGRYGYGGEEGNIYVAFEPNQIKSTSNRGTYSESENIYYQFAGENAKTAALDELDRAKQLEADGVDNEEIRQQTGWFKGIDGKWRFEISDEDATINFGFVREGNTRLGSVLKHENLYKAYPSLSHIAVKFIDDESVDFSGKHIPATFMQDESLIINLAKTSKEKIKSVLLHEIQHSIQGIEGFARGGSPATVTQEIRDIAEKLHYSKLGEFEEISEEANRLSDVLEVYRFSENPDTILKSHVLYEHGSPFSMPSKKDKKARKEYRDFLYDAWWQDMQEKYESRNDWEFFDLVRDGNKKDIQKEYYRLRAKAKRLLDKTDTKALRAYEKLVREIDNFHVSSYDAYNRLYGEIEARNTETRMDYTEEERRARTPESTQDVANAEAIVIFDDGTAMAYNPETYYQSAFAGSRVDYDRPSLEAIGSGEGNQAHGWGLYYALNRDVAEEYRESYEPQERISYDGKFIIDLHNTDGRILEKLANKEITKEQAIKEYKSIIKDVGRNEDTDFRLNRLENIDVSKFKKEKGQVHEVDIPENPYLLDEQKPFSEQSDIVKNAIKKLNNEDVNDILDDNTTGEDIYGELVNYFSKQVEGNDLKSKTDNAQKLASQALEKVGIKGITYDGRQDGRCFVIFNPADVKVIQKFYQKGKKIKGAFDRLTKSIKITKDADFSTYQHEFAHFWLDNIWDYVNSGKASEEYIKRFNELKKWLGVKPNQNYFTREQHEKFARGYEKFLYEGKSVNPIIADTFDDYEKFIREVYDDITEIDTRAGKEYEPLSREAYNFFNSMVSGELTPPANLPDETVEQARETVAKSETDAKEVVAEESKVLEENRANYKLEPVKTDTKTSYLSAYEKMTGEKVEAGVAELDKEMEKAREFVENNPDLAERVVNGQAPTPENMLKNTIYLAYQEQQKKLGNTDKRVNALLKQAQELRAYGQEIASQKLAYADQSTPLYWLSRVMSARAESIAEGNKMTASELQDFINKEIRPAIGDESAVENVVKKLKDELGIKELYQAEKVDLNTRDGVYKYVTSKLGITPTQEQAMEITKRADDMLTNLNNAQVNGNPSVDYFVKYKDLENYANSIAPSSNLRVLVSVVGKGNLLASFKSPLTNVVANAPVAGLQAALRRQHLGVMKSVVDPELIKQNKQTSWEIYRKTGYQLNNMTDVSPKGMTLGERITQSQGEGAIRKVGRIYENLIYKWSLGAPDLLFKDFAFNDYVSLAATKESGGDVAKANEIYKDAVKILPETELGQRIRQEAIEDSLISTYQNNGKISESALKIRKSMDFGIGFGEFIAPFVKTPANVVGMGLDTAFGGVRALASEIIRDVRAGKVLTPKSENIRLIAQNGLGLLVASLLLGAIDDDDYMPSYSLATNKDKQLAKELNIPFNAIRIGNTWYSMDYLGPLASPLMGLLQARRENGIVNSVMGYIKSGAIQTLSIPAFGNIGDLTENITNIVRKDGVDALQGVASDVIEATVARSVPSIVSDIAKVLDESDREAKTLKERLMTKVPLMREQLPEKYNVTTGRVEPRAENTMKRVLQDLFAGARVKEQVVNDVADELFRLNGEGYGVGLTDVTRSGLLSTVEPEKKALIKKDFAKLYSKGVKDLIGTYKYKNADDEDKRDMIDSLRRKYVNELKKKYLKKNKR